MTVDEYISARNVIEAKISEKAVELKRLNQALHKLALEMNKSKLNEVLDFLSKHNIQCPDKEHQYELKSLELDPANNIKVHWWLIGAKTGYPIKGKDNYVCFLSGYLDHVRDGYKWVERRENDYR